MPKYKVELQAIVIATVWVERSDEKEAQSIAENAWRPILDSSGIDHNIHAVYDYNVDIPAREVTAVGIEEWGGV